MKPNSKNIIIIGFCVVFATTRCSNIHETSNNIAKPPQSFEALKKIKTAQPVRNKTSYNLIKAESQAMYRNESDGIFKKFEERKIYGGTVTEIKINNRGNLPSYYLYPNQPQNQNINNQQLNISTPTWQISW
ncbi:MAG: hypothetical protein ACK5Z5_00510 [Neisseriaceae bacterium]|jgi:hypothetical protein